MERRLAAILVADVVPDFTAIKLPAKRHENPCARQALAPRMPNGAPSGAYLSIKTRVDRTLASECRLLGGKRSYPGHGRNFPY